jgi:hypothetical protein
MVQELRNGNGHGNRRQTFRLHVQYSQQPHVRTLILFSFFFSDIPVYICLTEGERGSVFFFTFMVAHFTFLLSSFLSYITLQHSSISHLFRIRIRILIQDPPSSTHLSPAQPIPSTLASANPPSPCIWETEQPVLSWCETNTSQSARQTRRIELSSSLVSAFMQVRSPFALSISATSSAVKNLPPGPLGLLIA